jgi:hypothetical protein
VAAVQARDLLNQKKWKERFRLPDIVHPDFLVLEGGLFFSSGEEKESSL